MLKSSNGDRSAYAIGFIDGLLISPMLGADAEGADAFHECLTGRTSDQIGEIILKHVEATPENWHVPLDMEAFEAIKQSCPALKDYISRKYGAIPREQPK